MGYCPSVNLLGTSGRRGLPRFIGGTVPPKILRASARETKNPTPKHRVLHYGMPTKALAGETCLEVLTAHMRDVRDGNFFGAYGFAFPVVRAVAEPFVIHLFAHLQYATGRFRLPLG